MLREKLQKLETIFSRNSENFTKFDNYKFIKKITTLSSLGFFIFFYKNIFPSDFEFKLEFLNFELKLQTKCS